VKLAEKISDALVEMIEEIVSCEKLKKIMNTHVMRERLVVIYMAFFQFLKLAVGWYQQSKLDHILQSLNENGSDQIDGAISKIKDLVDKMHREGGLAGLADGRRVRLAVEETQETASRIEQQLKEYKIQLEKVEHQLCTLSNLGQTAREFFEEIYR